MANLFIICDGNREIVVRYSGELLSLKGKKNLQWQAAQMHANICHISGRQAICFPSRTDPPIFKIRGFPQRKPTLRTVLYRKGHLFLRPGTACLPRWTEYPTIFHQEVCAMCASAMSATGQDISIYTSCVLPWKPRVSRSHPKRCHGADG